MCPAGILNREQSMNTQAELVRDRSKQASVLKIIDCDVHPTVRGGIASIYPYMPEAWSRRFIRKNASMASIALTTKYQHPNGSAIREDTRNEKGEVGGSDPRQMIAELIEPNNIEAVLLNCLQSGALCSALATVDESIVLASAFNDFFINEWLSLDRRFRYAMTVPSLDPAAAAEEIRRVGRTPQIAAVSVAPINILMGNRYWWPIYSAAQELELPIVVHPTGTDSIYQGTPISAGGIPDSYIERYVTLCQAAESNVNSLVISGTFEKFPKMKVLFAEYGFTWLLPLVWRMDRTWRQLRHETPWVRRSPVDYVHDHIRFTTQPLDEPRDPKDLDTLINLMGADHICFSTDYPHWDNDMPDRSLRTLSPADKQKVFFENAHSTLRLS
jgi:predicted TIM-barrel fold metal-dependent hydrolase